VKRVGVVGARGHVGGELLPILLAHGEVAWVTSSSAAGQAVPGSKLVFRAADPAVLASDPVDAILLALPNGESNAWAAAAGDAVVVDLSADHRFEDAWAYGQLERFRATIRGAKRIASPGCYATAAQLAIAPLVDVLAGPAHVFGVSGYSGAGTTKSERNDPEVLRDNLLPYALVGHMHERELRRHLGHRVYFTPHVAQFFRGLVVTVSAELSRPVTEGEIAERFGKAYGDEPFVTILREPPRPRDSVGTHGVRIGGFALGDEGRHVVVVSALDNLLGGAASQAVRAMNLALGLDERAGVLP
jgi:N-acetyl-gamma-glutamyl-phosphate reductase common form